MEEKLTPPKESSDDAEEKGAKVRITFQGAETRERNKQYYRFNDEDMEERAWLLMEKHDLTQQDILDFCNGKTAKNLERDNEIQMAYRSRRVEIYELLKKLKAGEAIVDSNGRLRAIDDSTPAALQNLPRLPPIPQRGANDAANNNNPHPNDHPPHGGAGDQQQHQQQLQRQTEEAISRAVERYRQQGIPMETVELIEMPIPEPTVQPPLTFRRILIAVTAVVLAFLFMLIQTIGRSSPHYYHRGLSSNSGPQYTDLVLQRRDFLEHVSVCAIEDRNWTNNRGAWRRWWTETFVTKDGKSCGSGVLVVPSPETMIGRMVKAVSRRDVELWTPFIVPEAGVNVTWWMPCQSSSRVKTTGECPSTMCFRGVHDALVSVGEVRKAISLGKSLIDSGEDHFDIHSDMSTLNAALPSVVASLATLLQTQYMIPNPQAVAFRVHAAAPLSGDGVQASPLEKLLNRANYRQWIEMAAYQNRLADHFPIPWPMTLFAPVRDTCNLLADQQANPSFNIHTTVFLSDHNSGMLLFVDEMKHLVTRGLAVESSPGRIVVSTGGTENERCRLPPSSGVSASLQVWWEVQGAT